MSRQGQYICQVFTDWTETTTLTSNNQNITKVTHLLVWRTWQCDALGRVMHLAGWHNLLVWCTWHGDVLANVTPLAWWRTWQGDLRDSGDAFVRKLHACQEVLIFSDFTTFTVPEFRWLTDKTINYWQCTLVMTNLLIPYFTEAEFTYCLWLKLRLTNKFVPAPR